MLRRIKGSATPGHRLRALAGCLALALFTAPMLGCSLFHKDEDFVSDTPADKLYNEGLFLLNDKQDYKEAAKKFDEVDRRKSVFGLGAQGGPDVGLRLLSVGAIR